MTDDNDIKTRSEIARLLTHRCNNCYSLLPGPIGCDVNTLGWNWATSDFGPFCDDCFRNLKEVWSTNWNKEKE